MDTRISKQKTWAWKRLARIGLRVEQESQRVWNVWRKTHVRQTSKMAQHNLFFYVKMYRVLLKVLARKGERYYIQGEEGRLPGQERMTWEIQRRLGVPPIAHESPGTKYKEVTNRKANVNRQDRLSLYMRLLEASGALFTLSRDLFKEDFFIFLKIVFNILQQR